MNVALFNMDLIFTWLRMDSGDSKSTTPSCDCWMAAAKESFLFDPFLARILDNEKPGIDCKTSFTEQFSGLHREISGLKCISMSEM